MSKLDSGYFKKDKQYKEKVMVAESHSYNAETVDDILAIANPFKAVPSRGISARVAAALGIRTRVDEFGDTLAYYFPYYKLTDGAPVLVGFKRKSAENVGAKSTYTSIGDIDVNCLLFGAVLRNSTTGKLQMAASKGKAKVVITEGEFDAAACMEALLENYKKDMPFPVTVSIGFGTVNAVQHISARINQEYLKQFETTVIAFDNDAATDAQRHKGVMKGQEALKAVADYLGESNIKVCALPPEYDPNDLLKQGRGRELFWAFTMPKDYSVAGFIEHSQIRHDAIRMPALGRPFPWPQLTKLTLGRRLGEGFYFGAGCVDSETEFLSPTGWVKISDYSEGMKVSQYNPESGNLEFVEPLKYIKAPTQGMLHLKTKYGVDQVLSGEHRFAFWSPSNKGTNKPTELPFHRVVEKHINNKTGFNGIIKTTFNYSGSGIDFTDAELRLQVAVMADGRIVKEGKDNYTQMRFNKKRKYDRLLEICETGGLKHSARGVNNQGDYEVIVWPKTSDKTFDAKYYDCTKAQLEIIAEELPYWDGTIYENGARRYFSAVKSSMDFAQFCYSALGQRCNLKIYEKQAATCESGYFGHLFIHRDSFAGIRKGKGSGGHKIKHFVPEDGMQYCFSVPSTFLILRRNGCVFITGNTKMGKSELLNEMVDHILKTEDSPPAVFKFEEEPAITCKKLAGKQQHKQFHNPEKVLFKTADGDVDVWGELIPEHMKHTYFTEDELEKAVDSIGDRVIYYNNYGAASWDDVAEKIRYAVTVKGCKDVFIDPLTRLTAGMESSVANTELERIADAISTMSKDLGFTYYIFCHLKAPPSGSKPHEKGGKVESNQFTGSRAMMRACYYMIGLERNKSDDLPDIIRNTSALVLLEDRAFGRTGRVALYYDVHTGDFRQPTEDEARQYHDAMAEIS